MAAYIKKAILVDAFQYNMDGPTPVPEWFCDALGDKSALWNGPSLWIWAPDGYVQVYPGDWIINEKDTGRPIYRCNSEEFAKAYWRPAEQPNA